MKNYFVMYSSAGGSNSFLIHDAESSSLAWDEAVAEIEKREPSGDCIITKFESLGVDSYYSCFSYAVDLINRYRDVMVISEGDAKFIDKSNLLIREAQSKNQ